MTDRCRCSHVKAAHYTNRWGRGMCINPCGCDTFRPEPADRRTPPTDDRYDPSPDGVRRSVYHVPGGDGP